MVDYHFFGTFSRLRKYYFQISFNFKVIFFAVSICPAAGQVVENTPCPAVKFFVNFQLIISNPCLYG